MTLRDMRGAEPSRVADEAACRSTGGESTVGSADVDDDAARDGDGTRAGGNDVCGTSHGIDDADDGGASDDPDGGRTADGVAGAATSDDDADGGGASDSVDVADGAVTSHSVDGGVTSDSVDVADAAGTSDSVDDADGAGTSDSAGAGVVAEATAVSRSAGEATRSSADDGRAEVLAATGGSGPLAGNVDGKLVGRRACAGSAAATGRRSGSLRMLEGKSGFGKRSATSSRACRIHLPRAAAKSSR